MNERNGLDQLIRRRTQLLLDLVAFESGNFQIALRRGPSADWQDQTAGIIDDYRKEMETLDGVIATLCFD